MATYLLLWVESFPPKFICWCPKPQYLIMWPPWKTGFFFTDVIKLQWGHYWQRGALPSQELSDRSDSMCPVSTTFLLTTRKLSPNPVLIRTSPSSPVYPEEETEVGAVDSVLYSLWAIDLGPFPPLVMDYASLKVLLFLQERSVHLIPNWTVFRGLQINLISF